MCVPEGIGNSLGPGTLKWANGFLPPRSKFRCERSESRPGWEDRGVQREKDGTVVGWSRASVGVSDSKVLHDLAAATFAVENYAAHRRNTYMCLKKY